MCKSHGVPNMSGWGNGKCPVCVVEILKAKRDLKEAEK